MNVKKFLPVALFLLCCAPWVNAQSLSSDDRQRMQASEDSLVVMADSMYNAFIPDTRIGYCEKFVKQLVRTLKTPGSFDYDFAALRKSINIIVPGDKSFRIFNWVIEVTDVNTRYYGAIQMASQELKLYPLFDYTTELKNAAEDSILTQGRWLGALYYNIIDHEVDGHKVYTLFGKNMGLVSTRKILDPLSFNENGVVFGAPIFSGVPSRGRKMPNRFIIEYKKEVNASMNWDDDQKAIYFDRLISQVNDPNRKYTFVPSGQYDGFKWGNDQWNYVQDLIQIQNFKDGEAPAPKPVSPKE